MSIGEGRGQGKLPSFFHPIQSVGIGGEGGRKPHPFDESVVKDESNKRPSTRFCENVTLRKELGENKRQREGGRESGYNPGYSIFVSDRAGSSSMI